MVVQVSVIFALFCVTGIITWIKGLPAEIHYFLILKNSQEVEVKLKPRLDGNVNIKGVTMDYKETIPLETFFNDRNWRPIAVRSREVILPIIVTASLVVLFLIFFIVTMVWPMRKEESLRRSLFEPLGNSPPKQDEIEP